MQSEAAPRGESRSLTGLRGLGALMVIAHHLYLHLHSHIHNAALEGLLQRGYMGVDLFFVLSGFVISMVYAGWFPPGAPARVQPFLTFLARRVARLWPLHAAVLLAILLTGVHDDGATATPHVILANFAMVQAWGISREINPPAWSISVELLAYLCFPLLTGPLLRLRGGNLLGLLAIAVMLGACLAYAPPLSPARRGLLDIYFNYSPLPALRCLSGFMLGMIAWRAGHDTRLRRWMRTRWAGPAALALFLLLLLARSGGLAAFALLPLVVLGMHEGDGPAHRLFAWGPLHGLGTISYAVYLVHYTLLTVFPFGWASPWLTLPCFLALTVAVAAFAHAAIEIPGRAVIRRLGDDLVAHLLPAPRRF